MTQPTIKLLPCPFCGKQPSEYATDAGGKWGWVQCCCNGPEVRTGYATDDSWHPDAANEWNTRAALTAQAEDGNRLPLEEFERGRQYGLKEALNCVCAIHNQFAKSRTAWDAIKQARKAINQKRCEVKRAAIAAAKDGVP